MGGKNLFKKSEIQKTSHIPLPHPLPHPCHLLQMSARWSEYEHLWEIKFQLATSDLDISQDLSQNGEDIKEDIGIGFLCFD